MGMVKEKDLTRILAMHTIESIQAASAITHGTFVFTDTPPEEIKSDCASQNEPGSTVG